MKSQAKAENKAASVNVNATEDLLRRESIKMMEAALLQALLNNMKITEIDITGLKLAQKSQSTKQSTPDNSPQLDIDVQNNAQKKAIVSALEEKTASELSDTDESRKQSILLLVDKLIEASEKKADGKHREERRSDYGAERAFLKQYQHMLEQYRRFLSVYLKESSQQIDTGAKMQDYDDPFAKADVVVPQREFGRGQEIMTNSEIRDIVRRKRMNWLLGNEHNYVSPDEKERYHFWKMFSKFNYVMAEGCMFNL
jgi:hypothetical protein